MPKVTWTGDASSAERAQQALTKAAKDYDASLKASASSAKRLDEQARRLLENAIPQEKYNRRMAELKAHGDLTSDEFERAKTKVLTG